MRKKAQAALEFLMTYGWAILLVIVAVGALYATGILKPCRWTGPQVREFPLNEVKVEPIRITKDELVFQVYYQQAGEATLNNVTVSGTADGKEVTVTSVSFSSTTFSASSPVVVTVSLSGVSSGACADFSITLNYTKPEAATYTLASGKISGPVS